LFIFTYFDTKINTCNRLEKIFSVIGGTFGEPKNHQITCFLRQLKAYNFYHSIQLILCVKRVTKVLKNFPKIAPTINLHNVYIVQVDRGRGKGWFFEAFFGSFKAQHELNLMVNIVSFQLIEKSNNFVMFSLFKNALKLH